MKLAKLTLSRIDIPFRLAFKHTSAERTKTEGVWVEARSDRGEKGVGEGCPRAYVTGESLASVHEFFIQHRDALIAEIDDLDSIRAWGAVHRKEVDQNPAAWCALELALIDLLACTEKRSVESVLGMFEIEGAFQYTAVLGDSDFNTYRTTAKRYLEFGFTNFKIKLSGNSKHDREKVAWLADHPQVDRIRLDGNNLWNDVSEAARFLESLTYPFFAIEEPLGVNRYGDLAALAEATGFPIILDESFLRVDQFDHLLMNPELWIVNLRVSKMGGLLRSLNVVDIATSMGIPLVIGAQVGETSVLTRVALTVASYGAECVVAQEGAFGSLLLESDVCDPPLMFGAGGVLHSDHAALTTRVGFGLSFLERTPFIQHIA